MKVIIIEDHFLIRMGLEMIISECDASAVVSQAETFPEGLSMIAEEEFDIIILGIDIPGGEGVKMLDQIRTKQKDVFILIHSGYDENVYALPYIKAGADGFLSKQADKTEIKLAWKTLISKRKYISESVQQLLLNHISETPVNVFTTENKALSKNELEVMRLMNEGKWNKEIALIMNLKENTISTYKRRIYDKLHVSGPIELSKKISMLKYF